MPREREMPLSEKLLGQRYKNLNIIETATKADALSKLIAEQKFKPAIRQITGGAGWVARARFYNNKAVLHFMNTAITAIPHPVLKDATGSAVLKDMISKITDNDLKYEIDVKRLPLTDIAIKSPELNNEQRGADKWKRRHCHTPYQFERY